MTAVRSSMPINKAQRADLRSTDMQGNAKHTLYGDIRAGDSDGQAESRRISLDPYDLNPPQLPAKLDSNNERQKFKTIQNFFPKQKNERPNQNGWIGREPAPVMQYGGPEKQAKGPARVRDDASG